MNKDNKNRLKLGVSVFAVAALSSAGTYYGAMGDNHNTHPQPLPENDNNVEIVAKDDFENAKARAKIETIIPPYSKIYGNTIINTTVELITIPGEMIDNNEPPAGHKNKRCILTTVNNEEKDIAINQYCFD